MTFDATLRDTSSLRATPTTPEGVSDATFVRTNLPARGSTLRLGVAEPSSLYIRRPVERGREVLKSGLSQTTDSLFFTFLPLVCILLQVPPSSLSDQINLESR